MLENFLAGSFALFSDPFTIGIFVFGVLGGMLFGAIPGVSMLTLAAILLPFTAGLTPAQGVMLFAVIYCTGTYGGAITAILFGDWRCGIGPGDDGGYRAVGELGHS